MVIKSVLFGWGIGTASLGTAFATQETLLTCKYATVREKPSDRVVTGTLSIQTAKTPGDIVLSGYPGGTQIFTVLSAAVTEDDPERLQVNWIIGTPGAPNIGIVISKTRNTVAVVHSTVLRNDGYTMQCNNDASIKFNEPKLRQLTEHVRSYPELFRCRYESEEGEEKSLSAVADASNRRMILFKDHWYYDLRTWNSVAKSDSGPTVDYHFDFAHVFEFEMNPSLLLRFHRWQTDGIHLTLRLDSANQDAFRGCNPIEIDRLEDWLKYLESLIQ